jgi:hypothetical protein
MVERHCVAPCTSHSLGPCVDTFVVEDSVVVTGGLDVISIK